MNKDDYNPLEEFTKYIREMSDDEVYDYSHLYFNVFQDPNVIKQGEMLLVAMVKSDKEKGLNALQNMCNLVESLTEEHVVPKWEEEMKKDAEIDSAIHKHEMKGE